MVGFSGGSDVYTPKRLKQKFYEHNINNYYEYFFAEVEGRDTALEIWQ